MCARLPVARLGRVWVEAGLEASSSSATVLGLAQVLSLLPDRCVLLLEAQYR